MDAAVGVVTEPVVAAETYARWRASTLGAVTERVETRGVDVTLRQGRAEQLPFDDASCDVVLAATVLCFVPDAEVAIRELARVLEPGACPDGGPRRSRPI